MISNEQLCKQLSSELHEIRNLINWAEITKGDYDFVNARLAVNSAEDTLQQLLGNNTPQKSNSSSQKGNPQ